MAKKPESVLRKPTLSAAAVLSFAEGAQQAQSRKVGGRPQEVSKGAQNANKRELEGVKAGSSLRITEAGKRSFLAPEGDKRLTINLRNEMHKKLRIAAVEQDTTIGEIIEELVQKHL